MAQPDLGPPEVKDGLYGSPSSKSCCPWQAADLPVGPVYACDGTGIADLVDNSFTPPEQSSARAAAPALGDRLTLLR